jgi:hypothetical protein
MLAETQEIASAMTHNCRDNPTINAGTIVRRRIGWTLLGIWAILSVAILGQFLYDEGRIPDDTTGQFIRGEIREKLVLKAIALGFPLSAVATALPIPWVSGPVGEWCVFTFAGFLQWTVLVPMLGRKLHLLIARRRSQPGP